MKDTPPVYKVEKGIKLPLVSRSRPSKYPWGEMKVGDSFFCKTKPASMRAIAWKQGRKNPSQKYSVRIVTGGVRVWRVK